MNSSLSISAEPMDQTYGMLKTNFRVSWFKIKNTKRLSCRETQNCKDKYVPISNPDFGSVLSSKNEIV